MKRRGLVFILLLLTLSLGVFAGQNEPRGIVSPTQTTSK